MRVGIDASRLRAGMTGVGRYTASLLKSLDAAMPDTSFTLFGRQRCDVRPPSDRWSIVIDRHPVLSKLPVTLWIHYRLGSLIANSPLLDVFWAPNTLIPSGLVSRTPCVVTVHDFLHDIMPRDLPPLTRVAYRRWMDDDTLAATKVVAVSNGTAGRMYDLLRRRADAVVYPSVPEMRVAPSRAHAAQVVAAMGIRPPLVMGMGTYARRKNLRSAIGGVELLKARGNLADHQLVLVGPHAWSGRNAVSGNSGNKRWLRIVGAVNDEELAALYSVADALLFPSIYEGFGMPVIEARAFGCRVVTTDSLELREAGGADAVYVNPTPEGVADGLLRSLGMPAPSPYQAEHNRLDAAATMANVLRKAAYARHTR